MRNRIQFQTAKGLGILGTVLLVFLMLSCSGGGGGSQESSGSPSGSGQIRLTLQLDESGLEGAGLRQVGAEFDCVGNAIETIEVFVLNASGSEIARGGPFNCVDGAGILSDIPAGQGYTVRVDGLDEEGSVIFRGEATGVTVLPNRVNAVGPVVLRQVKNRVPRILAPVGNIPVDEGQPLVFEVIAVDPDADQTLTYETGILPRGATFDPRTRIFSWTPGFADAGVYPVLLIVKDDWEPDRAGDEETVQIVVGEANGPPILAPPGTHRIDEGQTLAFTVSASDPNEEDVLTLSAGDLPRGAAFDATPGNPVTGTFTWETGFEDAGSYVVTFRVTDDGTPPRSDAKEGTITVGNVNRPPVLDTIGAREVIQGNLLEILVTARDPDDDNLAFSAANLPTGAKFDPERQTFSWRPGAAQLGTYTVLFRVVDDGVPVLGDFEEVTIIVGTGNRPPVLDPIGNREVGEGRLLEFVVTGTDPDNDPLVFSAENLPPGATFDPRAQRFSWQPGFTDAGNYPVTFRVSEDRQNPLNDAETMTITVGNVNRTPEITPIGTRTIDLSVDQEVFFVVTATDPDGDPLTYDMLQSPPGATFESQVFRWEPGIPDIGTHIARFRATDNQEPPLSDTEDARIIVTYPPLEVVSTSPARGEANVDYATQTITATFNREIDPATISPQNFRVLFGTSDSLSGSVSVSGRTAIFTIGGDGLFFGETYTVIISASVRDTLGVGMVSDYSWSFTTEDG